MPSSLPIAAPAVPPRRPLGTAISAAGGDDTPGAKQRRAAKGRRTGPSVTYKADIFGNYLTSEFVAEVENQFDRMVYRCDPRKIVRGIAKRTGATEEAVAHVLLCGKFQQYRAENREFRRCLAEMLPRVGAVGEAVWKRRIA